MARKKTRSLKSMSRASVQVAEQSHYGPEPDFTDSMDAGCKRLKAFDKKGKADPELAYLKSLNWYNAVASPSQHRKWLAQYAKDHGGADKKIATAIGKLAESKIPTHITTTARLMMRGGKPFIPNEKQEKVVRFVDALISTIKAKKEKKADAPKSNKPSVQDYMDAQAADAFGEYVTPMIDTAFVSKGAKAKNNHDLYEKLKGAEVSGRVAIKIADLIQPTIDELTAAIDKTDDDLVEGYSYLTKAQQKKVVGVLEELISQCNQLNETVKKTRRAKKNTKKRKPTAAKLLATFKYKNTDKEYDIVSVDPLKIVGASGVVLFNTKTRKGTYLIAADRTGLNIKGASIIGYDEKTSIEKTIRKPNEFCAGVVGKGKRAIKNVFNGINAKNTLKNGKANAHTVILAVVK